MPKTTVVPVLYQPGGAWGICQRCAFKKRLNDMVRETWTGLRVCTDCVDPRPDRMNPPNVYPEGLVRPDASPEPQDTFVQQQVRPEDL